MKKLLIVSGCSFTTDNYCSAHHPYMDTEWKKWPEILGEKLDMTTINLGKSGSGNEYVFSVLCDEILAHEEKNIGMVIAAWSQYQRKDYANRERWSSSHFEEKGDWKYFVDRSLRYYYLFQVFCESKNIPYLQFQMIEPIRDFVWDLNKSSAYFRNGGRELKIDEVISYASKNVYYKLIEEHTKNNFLGWPAISGFNLQHHITKNKTIEEYQISKDDSHPSALGHEKYAEFIYEHIQHRAKST